MNDELQTPAQRLVARFLRTGTAATGHFDEQERRLVAQALVVGVAVWAIVSALKYAAHWGFHMLTELMSHAPTVLLVLVPLVVGALIVATLAHYAQTVVYFRDSDGRIHELDGIEGDGLERAIGLYFSSEPSAERALLGIDGVSARWQLPTLKLALQKFAATFVTLSTGGSGGLEASVTLIGESTAAALFKPRPFLRQATRPVKVLDQLVAWWQSTRPEDLRAAQLCGISAAIATLLGTPFAAAFFAVEVMYRRRPIIDKLIYALISALVAFFLAHMTGAESPFHAGRAPLDQIFDARYYFALFMVALSISIVAIYFGQLRSVFDDFFHHRVPNPWVRHTVGALLTGSIAFLTALALRWEGSYESILGDRGGPAAVVTLVLGSGEGVIEAALLGELAATVAIIALVAKLLATLATITSGGSAGLLFPTMFFGTTVAVVWASVFGYPEPVVLIAPALTASLVSIVNVPLAAIFVVVELFGADWIVPSLFMLVTVSIMTHKNSIYRTQHETFDQREILPGVTVRHLDVPASCVGKTLGELDVRRTFGITVIGIIRDPDADIELNPSADRVLAEGERLAAIGDDAAFEKWLGSLSIDPPPAES